MLNKRVVSIGLRGLSLCSLMYLAASASADGTQCPWSFADGVNYDAGHTDHGTVAVGDLNGDGRPDLAAAISVFREVSVFLGIGDGTFQAQSVYGEHSGANSVAIGDLNGDGRLDLVTGIWGDVHVGVSVLMGNGDGTFHATVGYGAGNGAFSVTLGDFNGDDRLDVASVGGGAAWVLLGNGDGTFGAATSYFTGGDFSQFVAIGDLNRDGRPDLAIANGGRWSDYISVLFGNGDGTFGAPTYCGTGRNPVSLAVGDLNGDEWPDIVTTNYLGANISVVLNEGNGIFAPPVNYDQGWGGSSVSIGDVSGDDISDLAVAGSLISVFVGKGDGSFLAPRRYNSGGVAGVSVVIADLDGDGPPDLPVSGGSGVSVLLNTGCPPDFDCDGFATGVDFDLFVQAFETGDTRADFDLDGFLTGVDFDLYVQAFEEGC